MPAPRPVFGHEPGRLQGLLDEGVAEAHAVLPARQLMEMADVEALVAVAIQGQQALDLRDRRPLGRRRRPAAIEQAVIAVALGLQPQACARAALPPASRTAPTPSSGRPTRPAPAAATPATARGGTLREGRWLGAVAVLAVLVGWGLLHSRRVVPDYLLPGPSDVFVTFVDILRNGYRATSLLPNAWSTV